MNRKIHTVAGALALARECRRRNGKVVWTNGCFDILHVGHYEYLKFARQQGDMLIVGMNSDDPCAASRDPTGPSPRGRARGGLMAALDVVDAIVIFNEDTPIEAIKEIKLTSSSKAATTAKTSRRLGGRQGRRRQDRPRAVRRGRLHDEYRQAGAGTVREKVKGLDMDHKPGIERQLHQSIEVKLAFLAAGGSAVWSAWPRPSSRRCATGGACICAATAGPRRDAQHLAGEFVGRFMMSARRSRPSRSPPTPRSSPALPMTILTTASSSARSTPSSSPATCWIALSTSGNSPNVLLAVEVAKRRGAVTLGFSGRDGGKLKTLADHCLIAPAQESARIQELPHHVRAHPVRDRGKRVLREIERLAGFTNWTFIRETSFLTGASIA